jgi:hypothetical protein
MDGLIPVPELKDRLDLKELPEEDRGRYNTLAGMVMLLLGRLAGTATHVEWEGWRFEVVDLDGKRAVDKVLVCRSPLLSLASELDRARAPRRRLSLERVPAACGRGAASVRIGYAGSSRAHRLSTASAARMQARSRRWRSP